MQYRRISADCHLDMIWLPPDLFTSEAPRALKEKMPYVAEQPDGTKRWVANRPPRCPKATCCTWCGPAIDVASA